MDQSEFDIIRYLEDRGIDYGKSGDEDIGKGWIGIHCPFPNCSDHKHHLGINRSTKMFHCWLCGANGSARFLVSILEQCGMHQADTIMSAYPLLYPDNEDLPQRRSGNIPNYAKKIIPDEATQDFPGIHRRYLESRGFDPDYLIKEYHLYACYNIGRYRGRIIAPIYLNGRVVAFTTRDVTDVARKAYIDIPEEEAIIPVKHTLYNIDRLPEGGKGILVEGIFDVFRLGPGSVGSFTSSLTDEQKLMIAQKKLKRLFWMYDEDAINKARKLAAEMNVIVPTTLIKLDHGDPGELSPDDARTIRRDLLG